MKKIFKLSIFIFLFVFAIFASVKTYAESGNGSSGSDSDSSDVDNDNDDDDSNDTDDDSDDGDSSGDGDDSSALEIEADVFTNTTIVKIELNNRKNSFATTSKTKEEIVADILVKYPVLTQEQVEAALVLEIEDRDSRPNENAGAKKSIFSIFSNSNKPDNSGSGNAEKRPTRLPAESILNRFSGAVKHIEKFILRLENVIATFGSQGKDISGAQSFLDSAKTDLSDAKTLLQQAQDAWTAGGDGAKEIIREKLGLIKVEIRSAFMNLKSAIDALKDLRDNSSDDDNDDSDDNEDDGADNNNEGGEGSN